MSVESIILCPHPDDELHINFMSLCKQTENVILAIFTTGKAGLDDNSNISGADLVATRYRETLMAMHEIGIKPEQILFLGYSDGRENEDMTIKFKEQRIKQFILSIEYLDTLYNPKQIYAPLPFEVHIDHKYIGLALVKAAVKAEKLFSCYPKSLQLPEPDIVQVLSGNIFDERIKLCEKYYNTQLFLCEKLKNSIFSTDKYWFAESVERELNVDEIYQVLNFSDLKNSLEYKYLFDNENSKKTRVFKHLEEKYSNNFDPWNYQLKVYEKVRFNTLLILIKRNFLENIKIADMGCGNGEFIKLLLFNNYKLIKGFDFLPQPIEYAKNSIKNVEFFNLDFMGAIEYCRISSTDLFVFSDCLYYIHITEYLNLLDFIGSYFQDCYILISGSTHMDIKEYLAATMKYFIVLDGNVLEKGNTTYLSILFQQKKQL